MMTRTCVVGTTWCRDIRCMGTQMVLDNYIDGKVLGSLTSDDLEVSRARAWTRVHTVRKFWLAASAGAQARLLALE